MDSQCKRNINKITFWERSVLYALDLLSLKLNGIQAESWFIDEKTEAKGCQATFFDSLRHE